MPHTQEQRRAYYARPDIKIKRAAYYRTKRAENREKESEREKARRFTPKRQEWKRFYASKPEVKLKMLARDAARKEYRQAIDSKPEHKLRRRLYGTSQKHRASVIAKRIARAGRPPPEDSRCEKCKTTAKLRFDHDHKTGRFRGWICNACNTGLGRLGDSVEGLEVAIAYLRDELPWQGRPLPGVAGLMGMGC